METREIANILYNMSLDMDYDSDYFTESQQILEEEINAIEKKDTALYHVLESIAYINQDHLNCIAPILENA